LVGTRQCSLVSTSDESLISNYLKYSRSHTQHGNKLRKAERPKKHSQPEASNEMKNSTYKGMEFLGMGNSGPPLGIRCNGAWERSYQCPNVAQSGGATIPLQTPGDGVSRSFQLQVKLTRIIFSSPPPVCTPLHPHSFTPPLLYTPTLFIPLPYADADAAFPVGLHASGDRLH
jgi:hypothetical protein